MRRTCTVVYVRAWNVYMFNEEGLFITIIDLYALATCECTCAWLQLILCRNGWQCGW